MDCDDYNADVHPDATEICNGLDDDCDDLVDDADDDLNTTTTTTWYPDADEDGFGDGTPVGQSCEGPSGAVSDGTDCDDDSDAIHPDATEVCKGVDDDCDLAVDDEDDGVDPTTGSTWYHDGDGDGFGDPDSSVDSCLAGEGFVADSTDCDDTNAAVNPDAEEICNGLDDDCAPATSEDGKVSFVTPGGVTGDVTASFRSGGGGPTTVTASAPGAYHLCAGTYDAVLEISADVEVVGREGADVTTLSGGGAATVVGIAGDGLTVRLEGLTLTGGQGSFDVLDLGTGVLGGGGVHCEGRSSLEIVDSRIEGNAAFDGAGLHNEDCDTSLDGSTLSDNTAENAGGGLMIVGGTVTLTDAFVRDNTAGSAGGIYVGTLADDYPSAVTRDGVVDLVDTLVDGNQASVYGGGLVVDSAGEATCTGSFAGDAGFTSNTALAGGGVVVADALLVADTCDMGSDATGDNNSPTDFFEFEADYGANATFRCDGDGCQYTGATVADLAAGDLLVTEVMQNPAAVDDDLGEWFEVYNASGVDVLLTDLEVQDAISDRWVVADFLVAQAGSILVFGPNEDSGTNGGVSLDLAYDRGDLTLGNSWDELYLVYDYSIIDDVEWDNGVDFPDPAGASMSLDPDFMSLTGNDDGANWCEGASSYGDGDLGTPGAANDEC